MERMDSFRDRFGEHWLQYRRHLETGHTAPSTPSCSPTTDSLGSSAEASGQMTIIKAEQERGGAAEGKEVELPEAEAVPAAVETDCSASIDERDEEERPEGKLCDSNICHFYEV